MHFTINDKVVTRRYTPISTVNVKGSVTFVIKVYREHADFPGGGAFTQHLENNVQIGDSIMCEGPIGRCKYFGNGKFVNAGKELLPKKHICLIAGGTGLTPLFSVAQASVYSKDGMDVRMLFSNKSKDDILCQSDIEGLANENPENFKVFHTLTRHDEATHGEWTGLKGRVTAEMLSECGFPPVADDVFVFICGPNPFKKHCDDLLTSLGFIAGEHFNN